MHIERKSNNSNLIFMLVLLFFVFLTLFSQNFHNHSILEKHDSDCTVFYFLNLAFLISSIYTFVLAFKLFIKKIVPLLIKVMKSYFILTFHAKRAPPII